VFRWPQVDYDAAWRWQTEAANEVRNGEDEVLALLQHPPVYTFGRRIRPEHLLVNAEDLRLRGARVIESDRGGDITFHGPGQIVGYPILNLRARGIGPVDYVRGLEETLILAVACSGLTAERMAGRPGVWINGSKVGAIGVHVSGGVTTHGFALNVDTDLSWFDAIVPCGLADAGVTSTQRLLGISPGLASVEAAIVDAFAAVFDSMPVSQLASLPVAAPEPVLSGR
jgi:lipoate-protein ligase B